MNDPIRKLEEDILKVLESKNKFEYDKRVLVVHEPNSHGGDLLVKLFEGNKYEPKIPHTYNGVGATFTGSNLYLRVSPFPHCCGLGIVHDYHCANYGAKGFEAVLALVEQFAKDFMKFGKLLVCTYSTDDYLKYFKDYKEIDERFTNPKTKKALVIKSKTL